MLVTTNLVGFLVRGLLTDPEMANVDEFVRNEHLKGQRVANILALTLAGASLGTLLYFGNLSLVIAASMLVMSRGPDLVWEIRNRRKLEMSDMTKPKFYLVSTVLSWASLPVVWHALYGR
jgi:hypothetical protein